MVNFDGLETAAGLFAGGGSRFEGEAPVRF